MPTTHTSSARARDPVAVASLVAIGVVVALVSLPSLRGFALRQNESDALRIVRALAGASVHAAEREDLRPGDLLELDPSLRHRFPDLEVVDEGRALRSHGYLFDISSPAGAGPRARAWPWSHGRTGFAAFVGTPDGRVFGHANGAGRWSGPDRPPSVPRGDLPARAWHPMR